MRRPERAGRWLLIALMALLILALGAGHRHDGHGGEAECLLCLLLRLPALPADLPGALPILLFIAGGPFAARRLPRPAFTPVGAKVRLNN